MKEVEMWPPKGGTSVMVLPENVETMKGRGWAVKEKPVAKSKPVSATEEKEHG